MNSQDSGEDRVVDFSAFRQSRLTPAAKSAAFMIDVPLDRAPPPIEYVLEDIRRAHEAGLYYVAVAVALSLPDVCAALEDDPHKPSKVGERYIRWFNANAADAFKLLDAESCYRLRCGVLHEAKSQHRKLKYDRVLFLPPGSPFSGTEVITSHNMRVDESALTLGTDHFCFSMIETVLTWYEFNKESPNVIANMPNLVRYRPEGLSPHIVGVPLIG